MNKQSFFPRPRPRRMLAFALWIVATFHASSLDAFAPSLVVAKKSSSSLLYMAKAAKQEQRQEKKEKAPQYDKVMARLTKAEPVAKGAVLLHIEAADDDDDRDAKWDYEPGHVLALEIKGQPKDKGTHTYEDTMKNNGWMRGPYTVTSSKSPKELQVLLKVVGEKSQAFADAPKGTPIQVGGKFKVPIVDGIDVDSTSQVILLSTGVGVGPCVGAMEKVVMENLAAPAAAAAAAGGRTRFPPIHLVASFRTKEEIAMEDKLNQWQEEYPNQISWTPVITSGESSKNGGRVSSSVDRLQECLTTSSTSSSSKNKSFEDLNKIHFHLIGNGELVYEFQKGLEMAGIPQEKVTHEIYFNHQAKPKEETIDIIAKAIQGLANNSGIGSGSSSTATASTTTATDNKEMMEVSSSGGAASSSSSRQ